MWSNLMILSSKLKVVVRIKFRNSSFFGKRVRFYVDETEVLPRFGLSIKSKASINSKTQIKYMDSAFFN